MIMQIRQVKTVMSDDPDYHDNLVNDLLAKDWEIEKVGFTNGKIVTILVKYEFEDDLTAYKEK